MAKNIVRHVSHLKSSGTTAPAAGDLLYGEIAVGYGAGNEVLYIKNSSNQVIPFTNSASALAEAEAYTDDRVITTVVDDDVVIASLNAVVASSDSGRTLTVSHKNDFTAQSGFKKLSTDTHGHVTGSTAVALSDLTGLGALSGVTGENGISASTRASGNQKVGHTNIITAGTAKGSSGSVAHGGTIDIPSITYDANGHITASGKTTVTLPGNDNYITSVEGLSGISASVTSGKLTVKHTANITAGSAKTSSTSVTATPSGNNIAIPAIEYDAQGHIKTTGSTNVSLKVNSATSSVAGVVKIATSTGTNNSDTVMTQSAVTKAIEDSFAQQDAMVYKGLVGSGTNYGFPTTFSKGATYKVATAFTANGVNYEVGDMFIANTDVTTGEDYNPAHWDAIQTNLDPTLYVNTARTITTASGLTGGGNLSANRTIGLAATGTSGTYGPSADVTGNNSTTIKVPQITTDAYGRVTSVTERTYTSVDHTYTVNNGTFTISGNGASVASTSANASANTGLNIKAGTNVTITTATSEITISATDTTYTADETFIKLNSGKFSAQTGTSSTTLARGDHNHDGKYAKSAFTTVKINTTDLVADSTGDTLTISGGSFVTLTPDATNDKVTISVATGTSNSTVARGDHNHDAVYAKNAFSNVKVGSVNVSADTISDTVEFVATNTTGTNGLTITGDATNDKVTFNLGDVTCGDYA